MAEGEQNLGAAGDQSMAGTQPTGERVIRDVLGPLPNFPGWPRHTADVVSDAEWAALGPELEAYENGSAREHLVRAGGTFHSGSF